MNLNLRRKSVPFLILNLSFVITASARAAIFGADDRHVVTSSSAVQPLARATAIAVLSTFTTPNPAGGLDLSVDHLDQLCKDEKQAGEPSLSYSCTGFLVAPDLLVTAGHCVYAVNTAHHELKDETGLACPVFNWLFDFQAGDDGKVQTTGIPENRLYRCKKIIYAVQQEEAPYRDYALIQLDRAVEGRNPLKIATGPLSPAGSFSMIGHPYGAPTKYTDHGRILLNNPLRDSFITNLDAFEGNSGSPVFNDRNEVVGILVAGTPMNNTYTDPVNKCERFNKCDETGHNCKSPDTDLSVIPGFQTTGSEVQRITPILDLLKAR